MKFSAYKGEVMKAYFTTSDVAELSGVSLATVNNWIKAGALESFKTPGGHNRISQSSLKKFLDKLSIPQPPGFSETSNPRILVVEDEEDVRNYLMRVIEDIDYRVDTEEAADGFTAGIKVLSFRPHIVILDVMLPGINGIEVCRYIRSIFGQKVKIIIITGHFRDEYRARALEAGANEFLRKPVEKSKLKTAIEKLLSAESDSYFMERKKSSESNR